MTRRVAPLLTAIASLALAALAYAQAPAAGPASQAAQPATGDANAPRIRSGFLVRPDTVAVGDPFVLAVTVIVPAAARVEWPSIEDTSAVVAMRAPVRVRSAADGASRRETAEYELAAWDVGSLPVGLPDATVRYGTSTFRVPLDSARVFVRTVLPGDTSLHVPKPAKGLFPRVVPWWERWWIAAAVVGALLLLWWWVRRRRATPAAAAAKPLDIYARALHEFERLDRLALADAGERGRAVALAVEILRVYLAARIPGAALSRTSAELLVATSDDTRVPHDRLAGLLAEADAIKFARRQVHGTRARELALEARGVVEHVEHEERARREAEEERRRAAAREEANARQAEEDEARRRSRRKAGAA